MTSMPAFPARGSMDWHDELKTYLDAIQSRGDLPDGTNLDEIHGIEWAGSWQLRAGNTYAGLPLDMPPGITVALEVVYGGNVGTTHRLTLGDTDGARSGEWWREVALYNPGPDITWSPWHRSVIGEGVGRIISSPNYDYPLGDGDLLVVTPSETFFEDFSSGTVGGEPSGWSPQWVIEGDREIVADASAQGGKILRWSGGSGTARRGLRWDRVGTPSDVEIVIRHRASSSASTAGRPLARAGGSAGAEECYIAIVQTEYISLDRLTPTSRLDQVEHPFPWAVDDWFVTRLRTYGNQIKARTWPSSVEEPDQWHLTSTDSVHTSGWVGIQKFGPGTLDIDWVGACVGGGRAPVGRF